MSDPAPFTADEEREVLDQLVVSDNVRLRTIATIARFFAPEGGGRRRPYVVSSDLRKRMTIARALITALADGDLLIVDREGLCETMSAVAQRARENERRHAQRQ